MRIGDIVAGRYQLEEAVGAGGMGEVWRATDVELRRVVALKRATTGDSGETRREARIGAGLHHPNVISVFDVVVEDEQRWLVMEYLPARSLAEICRTGGPIAPELATRIGAQVAAALSAMHAKGMVHRDITQANILVTEDGTAKLADLGVAMWDQVTLTGSAKLAGTPGYVAPEVMEGHRATAASDLYSLGVTLSAAVEGHPRRDERLTRVLTALTDADPAKRPTAEKTAQLLGGPSARRISRRTLVGAGVAAVLGGTAAIVWSASGNTPGGAAAAPPRTSRRAIPPAGGAKLLYGVGDQLNSALASELARETPVRLLTTTYHKPSDLPTFETWRGAVAEAYAEGYALHVIVSNWDTDDPEVTVDTENGVGCGREYALSSDFPRHMRQLARVFAGQANSPPLYVTVFQEFNKMACQDGYYNNEASNRIYYDTLKDRYLDVLRVIHEEAPNARVAVGWDTWMTRDDDPETGEGRSMFGHFADILAASDYMAVLAKEPDGNVEDVRRAVRILGEYGEVMVAAYGAGKTPPEVVDKDVRQLLTDESVAALADDGLFAWSFNNEGVLSKAGRPTLDYVKDVVRRTAR